METITLVPHPFTLYRADHDKPPLIWSKNWSNTKQYDSKDRPKNIAGLFFFTDCIDIAKEYGIKYEKSKYYLTECKTTQELEIIDFSYCSGIDQMFEILKNLDINVFNGQFKTFEEELIEHKITFNEILELWEGVKDKTTYKRDSKTLFNVSMLGQRLTDFENGHEFIKACKASGLILDGYRWREGDARGFTYCLFNTNKLRPPLTRRIMGNKICKLKFLRVFGRFQQI